MNYYYSTTSEEIIIAVGLAPNTKKSILATIKLYYAIDTNKNCLCVHNNLSFDSEIIDLIFL
jgi:hypothetical protein